MLNDKENQVKSNETKVALNVQKNYLKDVLTPTKSVDSLMTALLMYVDNS